MYLKVLHTLIGILCFAIYSKAQVACGYQFEYSNNIPYQALPSGDGTIILASGAEDISNPNQVSPTDEDIFLNQSIGFPFTYNGSVYSSCGVSTNGWIWFGNNHPVKAAGVVIPFTNILYSDNQIEGIVSALNGDLEGRWTSDLASIKTRTLGSPPQREFIIEWNNFKALDDAEGTGFCGENRNRFDFQIILQEENNKISFAYRASEYCWQGYEQYFQVGLRGSDRSDIHTRSISPGQNTWATSAQGFNTSTVVIQSSTPITIPAEQARFSFYPGEAPEMTWLGVNDNWHNPNNWNTGNIPGRCNNIIIPGGLSYYPHLRGSSPATCKNLIIQSGGALTLNEDYNSFLSCFGNLVNDGVIINNTNSYITLAGAGENYIGGGGHFIGSDLFLTAESEYHLQNDLVIRNLSINNGASLYLEDYVLDVFSIIQSGIINQGNGILVIEGGASSVQLTDSTFQESNGTTFFGNGEVWSLLVNQTVPSITYNNLWVRTKKNFDVQLGSSSDFTCKSLMFYNPGEAGGIAKTNRNINVLQNLKLGIDSLPGTLLELNHSINSIGSNGQFDMGKEDALAITHAPATLQPAISGYQSPTFAGQVSYNSGSAQTVINGNYTNLTINGSGTRTITGKVNLKGVLTLNNGVLQTNDSLSLKSDSLGTGLVSGRGSGVLEGDLESERYIHGSGLQEVLISSPFDGLQIIDYESAIPIPGPDGISWMEDESPVIWEYKSYEVNSQFTEGWYSVGASRTMHSGMGVKTSLEGGSVLKIKGAAVSGAVSIPVLANGNQGEFSGYNLIGNPYPSPINWNTISNSTPVSISKSFHRKGSGNLYNGTYATWLSLGANEGLGINGASQYIGVQEAFFVKAFENDTIELNNSVRADIVNVHSVNISNSISYIKLSLNNDASKDETLIYFKEDVNNDEALDGQDAPKISPPINHSSFFSRKDNIKLGIQGRAASHQADSIPLGMQISESGYYQIRLSEFIHFPATAMVFLEDRLHGTFQNMRQNGEYEVYLNDGEINDRFFIHYRPGVTTQAIKEGCEGNDGQITLNNPTATLWDVNVYNSLDSLIGIRSEFTGNWVLEELPADEYRINFLLSGQNVEIDEWVQVEEGSGITASFTASLTEVKQDEEEVVFTNTTPDAQSIFWEFGNAMMVSGEEEVSHIFTEPGNFPVVLTATKDECADTAQITIHVITITGIEDGTSPVEKFTLFPNPASSIAYIKPANEETLRDVEYVLVDASGRIVMQRRINILPPGETLELQVSELTNGAYEVVLSSGKFRGVSRLIVQGY